MKLPLILCATASVLLLASSAVHAQTPGSIPASAATPPPLNFHARTLANGLRVFTALDRTTPNVTVQVWYGVGGKDDPEGRSGFAHLFEHMMFKATRDMPAETLDRLTEDVGGFNNASTWDDLTNYYEVIPANHLGRLLWAEAQRMSSLVVDQSNFESERAVVEEELRQRVLADPYGRWQSLLIPEASFSVHPYKRPVIGSIHDLDAATLADVQAFHATYYRPDNASLIVIGAFDPAQLDAWIDQDFGPIGHPSGPIPRVRAVEPARTAPKTVTGYGPNVPLPALAITFLGPAGSSADGPALAVADAILSTGHSSRLYRDLVYQQQLAQSAFSEDDERQQPGLFVAGLILASGKTLDQGEDALRAELKQLRDAPVAAAELARAKNQLTAQALRERETVDGRAFQLGRAILIEGDPTRVDTDIAAIQAVTAADVQRVARAYLADERRVVVRYMPETARPAGGQVPSPEQASRPVQASAPTAANSVAPPAALSHTPPEPGAALLPRPPKVFERMLSDGLRVIVAKTSDLPIVTAELTVKSGASADPAGLAGLQSMTTGLLPQGSTTRSAPEISEAVEALGGALTANTGADASHLVLTVLADQLGAAMPILADVARHPAFAPEELDRLRRQRLDQLEVETKEPGALGRLAVAPVVFGDGGYGHPASGTPASLARVGTRDVAAQYARTFQPGAAILVLTGDIDPEQGFALAERNFGDWTGKPTTPGQPRPQQSAASDRVVVIDLPGAGQAAVILAGRSIRFTDPRFYAVEVADAVLGGGYSARLNEEIRVKRGLSYGAGSEVDERLDQGLFVASAQTKNESAPDVADLLIAQARGLGSNPIPAGELAARKAALVGQFGRAVETSAGLAGELSTYALYGVDLGEIGRFIQKIDAISPAEAQAAAGAVVDPDATSLVIVGDAKLFIDKLRARFPKLERVSAAGLNLGAPSLGGGGP